MKAWATTTAAVVNGNDTPSTVSDFPRDSGSSEGQQQDESRHRGRNDHGELDQNFGDPLSRELSAGEQVRGRETEQENEPGSEQTGLEAEQQRLADLRPA